jgi:hypothetical protein
MKSKTNKFGKTIAGFCSIAALCILAFSFNGPKYEPRKESGENLEKSRTAYLAAQYYFNLRKNAITGDIPLDAMAEAKQAAKEMAGLRAGSLGLAWTDMGPDNVGGRTRCFLIDNQDPTRKTLYAGGVNGGLWKSTNGGGIWTLINDQWDNIAAVSICQEPGGKIYVGTGELLMAVRGTPGTGNSSCIGSGIWQSTDGTNFTQIPGTDPSTQTYNNTYNSAFSYVYSLGYYQGKLYAGTISGLRISADAGATWTNPLNVNTNCKDIEIGGDGTIYASVGGKMYVSNDGSTFTVKTLPSAPNGMSNLQISSSPSDPNYVYCIGSRPSSYQVAGVWKSVDKGNTFSLIPNSTGGTTFQILGNQGDYACAIGVDPGNKDRIICGGLDLWAYSSTTGWNQISAWNYSPISSLYNHADHHQVVFDKMNPSVVYFTNDGGIFKSTDGGQTFAATNRNFSVTQFYSVATSVRGEVLGGTQDNGTNLIDFNGPTQRWAKEVMGGDGFDCDFSSINPDASFASLYFGDLRRSGTMGGAYSSFFRGAPTAYLDNSSFHTVIRLWESFNNQQSEDVVNYIVPAGQTIQPGAQFIAYSNNSNYPFEATYTGTTAATTGDTIKNIKDIISSRMAVGMINGSNIRVFLAVRPLNFSDSPYWLPVAVNQTVGNNDGLTGEVTSLSFSSDGNHLYVGTQTGGGNGGSVYRVSNLNSIKFNSLSDTTTGWINNANSQLTCTRIGLFTGQAVTSIAVDPNDAAKIIVTLGNYANNNYVYRCNNANTVASATNTSNFTNIQGNMPKMPIYSSLIDYTNGNRIILGTEYGIWTSNSGGSNWTRDNDGMANCAVFMLRQQTQPYNKCWNSGAIYAATHGRGIFRTNTLLGVKEDGQDQISKAEQMLIYPNPVFEQATIKFNIPVEGMTTLSIFDLHGKLVRNFNMGMLKKGTNMYNFENDGLNEGTYIASVNNGSYKKVVKFVVKK